MEPTNLLISFEKLQYLQDFYSSLINDIYFIKHIDNPEQILSQQINQIKNSKIRSKKSKNILSFQSFNYICS